jgi:hypothetical protein
MDDLHVDTLILISTLKIHVFWYSRQIYRQTDRQTEREINLVWASITTFLQVNFNSYLPIYFDVCFSTEAFDIFGWESAGEVDVQGLMYPCPLTA